MRHFYQSGLGLFLTLLSLPVLADTQFQVRRTSGQNIPLGTGQCDIRVLIDNEAEVSVQGDSVHIRTLQGREGRDAGSECNAPLPTRGIEGFQFQVIDRRGDIVLLSDPSQQRFGSGAVVRIRDSDSGKGRYHFRLNWVDRGNSTYDRQGQGRPGDNPPGGGYGRGGRWGNNQGRGENSQGLRFGVNEAINLCSDTVRNNISRDYRYSAVEILNARPDERQGGNDTIVGEAVGRRGSSGQQFTFACRLNLNNNTVQAVDIRRR